jgi:hypothetical protein
MILLSYCKNNHPAPESFPGLQTNKKEMEDINYINQVGREIFRQIFAGGWNVPGSWGFNKPVIRTVDGEPALTFQVSGLIFTGLVTVIYNEIPDTYTIRLTNRRGEIDAEISGIYCDQLTAVIDNLVEKPVAMSESEYARQSWADSCQKIIAD